MRQLTEIQADINMMEQAIQNGGDSSVITTWQAEKNKYEKEYAEASTYWADQAISNQLAEARANGYIFDTLKNGDYTMAELAYSPEGYTLQCIAVQTWAIELKSNYERKIAEYDQINEDINKRLYQANQDNADLAQKLKNATDMIAEKEVEIAALKANQTIPTTTEIAPLTAEEQDAQWQALNAMKNNRIKITNLRLQDESGNDTRTSVAELALTEDTITFPTIYKTRYVEITEAEAIQLRFEYAQKKADIEASKNIPELQTIPEEPAAATTPQEIPTAVVGVDGNTDTAEVVGAETKDVVSDTNNTDMRDADLYRKPVTRAEHEALEARVTALESGNAKASA